MWFFEVKRMFRVFVNYVEEVKRFVVEEEKSLGELLAELLENVFLNS